MREGGRVWRGTFAAGAVALVWLCVPAGAQAACADADLVIGEGDAARAETAVRCLVDEARARIGQPPLRADAALADTARDHARDMVARTYFDHLAPSPAPHGATTGERALAHGYTWDEVGEALFTANPATPRGALRELLGSDGHCQIVLDEGRFADLGVGVVPRSWDGGPGATMALVLGHRSDAKPLPVTPRPAGTCPGDGGTSSLQPAEPLDADLLRGEGSSSAPAAPASAAAPRAKVVGAVARLQRDGRVLVRASIRPARRFGVVRVRLSRGRSYAETAAPTDARGRLKVWLPAVRHPGARRLVISVPARPGLRAASVRVRVR